MPGFDAFRSIAEPFLHWLLITSLSATLIAGAVITVQTLFGRWLTPAGRQRLWLLVLLRLLLPILPASALSIANFQIEKRWTNRQHVLPVNIPAQDTSQLVTTIQIKPLSTLPVSVSSIAAAPEIKPERNWKEFLPDTLMLLWITGVVAMFIRLLWVNHAIARRVRDATVVADIQTLQLLHDCARLAGVRIRVQIVATNAITTPAVFGIARPRILVPPGLLESLTATQQRHILLHELSHVRHRDVLANWMLALLSIIHWFNPLLWLAFSRLKSDREVARDVWVIEHDRATGDADGYADTLIDLAQRISIHRNITWPQLAAPLPGLFGRKTSLRRRLQMISRQSNPGRTSQLIGVILLMVVGVTTLTRARAQTPPAAADKPAQLPTPSTAATTTKPASTDSEIGRLHKEAQERINARLYKSALSKVKEILALDPVDSYAIGVEPLLEDKIAYEKEKAANAALTTDAVAKKEADAEIVRQRQLNRVLPSVQFDAVGFGDVVDFMRDISGDNIFVNWKVLEAAGISRNTPVTANVHNIKFSKALDLILDSVGGGQAKLGFRAEDGVFTISTKEDLQKDVSIRVYDVRDLLESSAMDPAAPLNDTRSPRDRKAEQLVKLIEDTVDPTSWKDRGGAVAALRLLDTNGQMIVTQTKENDRAVVAVLDRLRAHRGVQILLEGEYYDCDSAQLTEALKKWWAPTDLKAPTAREASNGVVLGQNQLQQLAAFKNSGKAKLLASPRFMLIDGQQAVIQTSMKRTYIGDYMAVHDNDGKTRYEPVQRVVEPGIEIEAHASVDDSEKVVRLSIHPKVTTLAGMATKPWPGRPESMNLAVEVPRLNVSEAQVSAVVPAEQTLVVVVAQQEHGRSLLILVKPTIVHQTSMLDIRSPATGSTIFGADSNWAQSRAEGNAGQQFGTIGLSSHYPWMQK